MLSCGYLCGGTDMANGLPAPRESAIVGRILKYLNSKPMVKAIKLHGDAYSVAGTPDILCVIGDCKDYEGEFGFPVLLEVKRPGNTPTLTQKMQIGQWIMAGAVAGVVHSLDEVKELLRAHGIDLDG
jgi:hypothetical protein